MITIRRILFLILTLIWMIIIFSFSAKPADVSDDISLSVGHSIGQLLIDDFNTWDVNKQEAFAEHINYPVRKCAHAAEYAILGIFLAGTIVMYKQKRRVSYFLCFLIGVAYAISDEIHQLFVPGRACRISDVCIDTLGLMIGLLIVFTIRRFFVRDNQHKMTSFD